MYPLGTTICQLIICSFLYSFSSQGDQQAGPAIFIGHSISRMDRTICIIDTLKPNIRLMVQLRKLANRYCIYSCSPTSSSSFATTVLLFFAATMCLSIIGDVSDCPRPFLYRGLFYTRGRGKALRALYCARHISSFFSLFLQTFRLQLFFQQKRQEEKRIPTYALAKQPFIPFFHFGYSCLAFPSTACCQLDVYHAAIQQGLM